MLDPLTALGLASNIGQFVGYGLKLLSTSIEIATSATGATSLNLELEHAYTTLQTFTSELKLEDDGETDRPPSHGDAVVGALGKAHSKAIRPHIAAIQGIAVDCQAVCNELLDVVNGLRVDPASSKHRLKSLAAALRSVFSAKKIAGLEEQLKRFQGLLALHFLPLLNERQAYMTRLLASLKAQNSCLEMQQSDKFEKISGQLDDLLRKIQALRRDGIPSTSGGKRERCVSRSEKARKATPTREPHDNESRNLHPNTVEDLGEILNGLSLAEKDITLAAKVQRLLESLHFKSRNDRHEAIHEAHKATFEWIFSDQKPVGSLDAAFDHGTMDTDTSVDKPTSRSFTAWLESGRGTFWVSGKPGSGKSTLMKFVADHAKTRQLLQKRARAKRVIVASHYFWNSGTPMQKSVKGLLQQLLLDILCQCHELALDVFPHRLQDRTTVPWTTNTKYTPAEDEWTIRELHRGLLQIANHPALPIQCCFFIDGLDEYLGKEYYLGDKYSGDYFGLCEILKDLATSENVQCCVSSRPFNVFDDAFGSRSGVNAAFLHVHELTYNDIRLFAKSRLQSITRWKEMGISDAQVDSLVQFITENAKGVFLWVFLVTKSLSDGVIDGDTFDDLHLRLKTIPTELDPYFKHMLDRVNAVHHRYMAQTLQVAANADAPLDLKVYYILERELEDTNYALEWPADLALGRRILPSPINMKCLRRVNARCGGLLVVKSLHVEFIHRTVNDFLKTGPMQDYLQSKVVLGFLPRVATLKAFIFLFRCAVRTFATAKNDFDFLHRNMQILWDGCLLYAGYALIEDEATTTRLLDTIADVQQNESSNTCSVLQEAIDSIVKNLVILKPESDGPSRESRLKTRMAEQNMTGSGDAAPLGLRHTYLKACVGPYVLAKLRSNPSYFDSHKVSLLGTAMNRQSLPTDAQVVTMLLEAGYNPNEKIQEMLSISSPWNMLLDRFEASGCHELSSRVGCSFLTAFLRHGASRAPIIERDQGSIHICAVYSFLEANFRNEKRFLEQNTLTRTARRQYEKRAKLELQTVFQVVDVFLDTSPDNKRVQLKDILSYIQTWEKFPPRTVSAEERVATVAFVDKMILMAIELCLHANEFPPLLANKLIRRHVSPSVLATLADYVQSHSAPAPDTLLSAVTTGLKRESCDSDVEEREHGVKRSRLISSYHGKGTDPSNAIVLD